MNVDNLMDNLEYAVTEATKTLQLPTNRESCVAPKIARGYLPSKDPRAAQPDAPCVIVRLLGDETADDDTTTAQVKIVCIAFSEDDAQGWRELLTIMDPIRTYFLTHRNIGDCYRIELPLKRDIPEEQQAPEWFGEITFDVAVPTVLEVNEDVREFLSNGN